MPIVRKSTGAVPDSIQSRTREQFLAAASGSLSHDDLYWILYRAATDHPNSGDDFCNEVKSLVESALGAGNYMLTVNIDPNSHGGSFDYEGTRLGNVAYWGGDAGLLPGLGRNNAITCVVFWG